MLGYLRRATASAADLEDVPYFVCRVNHYFAETEKRLIEKRKLPQDAFENLQVKLNAVEDRSLIKFKNQAR